MNTIWILLFLVNINSLIPAGSITLIIQYPHNFILQIYADFITAFCNY